MDSLLHEHDGAAVLQLAGRPGAGPTCAILSAPRPVMMLSSGPEALLYVGPGRYGLVAASRCAKRRKASQKLFDSGHTRCHRFASNFGAGPGGQLTADLPGPEA